MYDKINSLQRLKASGYNTFAFIIPETFKEFKAAVKVWKHVTVRTDHNQFHEDLPFFIIQDGESNVKEIWELAVLKDYKLIVSNGIKYDPIQLYNAVCKVSSDGTFHIEASKEKVPLRKMYNYDTINLLGNLCDSMSSWEHYGRAVIDFRLLRDVVNKVYEKEIFDKFVELTVYPKSVGILNDTIIYWQVREKEKQYEIEYNR